jgi:CHAT domain-containing protein/tetratricopeptide (TPR) repeat protein
MLKKRKQCQSKKTWIKGFLLCIPFIFSLAVWSVPLPKDLMATEIDEKNLENLFQEGTEAYRKSDYHGALERWNEGLRLAKRAGTGRYEWAFASKIGTVYQRLCQYLKAISYHEQAVTIAREIRDSFAEAKALINVGVAYRKLSQYEKGLSYHEQALPITREIGDRSLEAKALTNIGVVYRKLSQYRKGLDYHNRALSIVREIGDRAGEGRDLTNIGIIYWRLGLYKKALIHYEQALSIKCKISDRAGEGAVLGNIGIAYASMDKCEKALTYHAQALSIAHEIGDRAVEAEALTNIGIVYQKLSQYDKALDYLKHALSIVHEIGDRSAEATALTNIGVVYRKRSRYEKGLDYHNRALSIVREIGDRAGEGRDLTNIGIVYWSMSKYERALNYHKQALLIAREINDRALEARALTNIGVVYGKRGQYKKALSYHEQALAVVREIDNRYGVGVALTNIGIVYKKLNKHDKALPYYEQALAIDREIKDLAGEGIDLTNIGALYASLGEYNKALGHHNQAKEIARKIGDRSLEGEALTSIGVVYRKLGQCDKGLDYHKDALLIARKISDRSLEGKALTEIGEGYFCLGKYNEALIFYEQALGVANEVKELELLWRVQYGLFKSHRSLNNPSLAIFFGKESIKAIQLMRNHIGGLRRSFQQTFIEDKHLVYEQLASLLIDEKSPEEAQQILALLKEEEYFDFIGRRSENAPSGTPISYTTQEKYWEEQYAEISNELVEIAQERSKLEKKKKLKLTVAEEARLAKLRADLKVANIEFKKYLTELKMASKEQQREFPEKELKHLRAFRNTLRQLGKGTVVIYYLSTDERLQIIVASCNVSLHRNAEVGEEKINDLISAYRRILKNPFENPLPQAQELYEFIFKPIEDDLEKMGARTLLVYLKGKLRYLPLSALHDGKCYVADRYAVVIYTPAAKQQLIAQPDTSKVACLGVSEATPGFSALEAVPEELDGIVKESADDRVGVLPGKIHLNEKFTKETFSTVLQEGYPVVHVASHFHFVPGTKVDSFLLLGAGDRLSLEDFENEADDYPLDKVNLLTLSACETGSGSSAEEDGSEVEGFGVLAQQQGAKAVLATLWRVADRSTAKFMQLLYRLRQDENLTKAEALRQAQQMFIRGQVQVLVKGQKKNLRSAWPVDENDGKFEFDPNFPYAHPYYWAPFILMGNFL